MRAAPHRCLLVALLASALTVLLPLAHAAPPDPTWTGGLYDDGDYDDVVLAVTSAAGVAEVGPLTLVAPPPVPVGVVVPAAPGDPVVVPLSASQIRAPPSS
jgi:hypothetical protein